VFKLVTPRLAPARFALYLIETAAIGLSVEVGPGFERFLFGLTGEATVHEGEMDYPLDGGGFAYIPSSHPYTLHLNPDTRILLLKRRFEPWEGLHEPKPTGGHALAVEPTETVVPGLIRRELINPLDPSFDFNMSLLNFDPGVESHQIEIHDEEHGIYVTHGGGEFHLDGADYPVTAEDFVYMAPYCPQGFLAGEYGTEYLLYKDVYRDGF
jgi:(S)-ureidoglycine aminohydrolase